MHKNLLLKDEIECFRIDSFKIEFYWFKSFKSIQIQDSQILDFLDEKANFPKDPLETLESLFDLFLKSFQSHAAMKVNERKMLEALAGVAFDRIIRPKRSNLFMNPLKIDSSRSFVRWLSCHSVGRSSDKIEIH